MKPLLLLLEVIIVEELWIRRCNGVSPCEGVELDEAIADITGSNCN